MECFSVFPHTQQISARHAAAYLKRTGCRVMDWSILIWCSDLQCNPLCSAIMKYCLIQLQKPWTFVSSAPMWYCGFYRRHGQINCSTSCRLRLHEACCLYVRPSVSFVRFSFLICFPADVWGQVLCFIIRFSDWHTDVFFLYVQDSQ